MLLNIIVCLIIGYFLGNINPAYLICRRKGFDVRETGSGNAGATNTFLLAGKRAFAATACTDILKTAFAWRLCGTLFPELAAAGPLAGMACLVGHIYPVFLGFRGGKGFACLGGMALGCSAKMFFMLLAVAVIILLVSRYMAVTACSMSVILPGCYLMTTGKPAETAILCIPTVLVFWKHRENFARIRQGKELRISYLINREAELERIGAESGRG